jgi:2-methylcitrate dehydratase PrpD
MHDGSALAAKPAEAVIPASVLLDTPREPWLPRWAQFAVATRDTVLPDGVIQRAKLVILDSIGAIAGGMQEPELRALVATRPETGTAVVIGSGTTSAPARAAFLNGVAGTTLELDEGNQFARGHPAIHIVPALLACADDCSGAALLNALVLGYDIGSRIGIASRLKVTMHPHGTWGTIGAALAIATIAGADEAEVASTINIAAGLSLATSRRTMLEGATVRNCFAGLSNQFGILAWDLSCAGFSGEADAVATVFDQIVADDFRPNLMLDELGERWEIARNYFKMHAACRYTHAALDVLTDLAAQSPFTPDDVVSVDVETYCWAAQLDRPAPQTMLAAKFSIPFAIATTIIHGAATPNAFRSAALADPAIAALALKVRVSEDQAMTAALPDERPARVIIDLRDGRSLVGETRVNRGDTEFPYAAADILGKFRSLATPIWGAAHVKRIIAEVMGIDQASSVKPLLALLGAPPLIAHPTA